MDENINSCTVKFSFVKKVDKPFLILKVQALFNKEKSDFKNKVKQKDGFYVVWKNEEFLSLKQI